MRGHGYIERMRERKENQSGFNNEKRKRFLQELSENKIAANQGRNDSDDKNASRIRQESDRGLDVSGSDPGDERGSRQGNRIKQPARSKTPGRFVSQTKTNH